MDMLNRLRLKYGSTTQKLKSLLIPSINFPVEKRFVPISERQCHLYKNKVILAPMVRVGFLPARLLALRYGADLVYTDETFSQGANNISRKVNDGLGTIDFVDNETGRLWLRTCEEEKGKVVLQLGTKDGDCALKAAKLVEKDVLAVDVNMGCPAASALAGGTGSALLDHPDKIESILRTLVNGLSIPVTCKIRVYPSLDQTIELVKMIESTGVAALAVHGRTRKQRSKQPCQVDAIQAVVDAVSIPVIANGGSEEHMQTYEDIEKFRQLTNASSVMIARSAQFNCSIFRKEGLLPLDTVIKDYLKLALQYDLSFSHASFVVKSMITHAYTQENYAEHHHRFLFAATYPEACHLMGISDFYDNVISTRGGVEGMFKYGNDENFNGSGSSLSEEQSFTVDLHFKRSRYDFKKRTPKSILHEVSASQGFARPIYQTVRTHGDRDRISNYCNSSVLFDGMKYRTRSWQRTRSLAEQAAAAACLASLGIDDGRKPLTNLDIITDENNPVTSKPVSKQVTSEAAYQAYRPQERAVAS